MEDVLKKIIEIDNNAKDIINEEKAKKLNIEEIIEQEYKTQKTVIDLEYKNEILKNREEKNAIFEDKKREINNNVQIELERIQNSYYESENNIIEDIVSSIKNEEN